MSKTGLLGDALGQLGDLGKQTGKSLVQSSGDLAKTAARQIGAAPSPEATAEQFPPKADQPLAEKAKEQVPQQAQQAQEALRQHQTKEVVASLYAPTPTEKKPEPKTPLAQTAQNIAKAHPEKTPEQIQREAQQVQELHKTTYYDPLVTPPQQPEEKPAEKVEREKMKDLQEKQKKDKEKEKKNAPVDMARNIEKHRGASG